MTDRVARVAEWLRQLGYDVDGVAFDLFDAAGDRGEATLRTGGTVAFYFPPEGPAQIVSARPRAG